MAEASTDRRAPTDQKGVDRTQIRALLRLTPTERMRRLVEAANNLVRLRNNARRV